ncbi:aminopeptidase N [Bartonella tamiae]|uniref:Aminopeptidase N n=1 Tax=Bartonella tamiae Th239 TaxID=1094558 RepID=J1JZN3_9HYPH|nr:aminopeptidase N [Bartonella tamiae]EJF90592.1 aminopeptidase N [Bartonella tamiae Th239]EJF94030.1 aminopeptidase N [Bartonella tamiae Th307]
MSALSHPVFRLEDYRPTEYAIPKTDLDFSLHPTKTRVHAKLSITPRQEMIKPQPLVLSGDGLKLLNLSINGEILSKDAYHATENTLEILHPPKGDFIVEITTDLDPEKNRQLMGLYLSKGVYCTQCEAEGFRRITYFYDRPDVLSVYTVRIEADRKSTPILLSNGNLIEEGKIDGERHYAIWHDPFPKPSYLFALVGGNLDCLSDNFETASGRNVKLGIYVEKGKKDRANFAMHALKRSMRWDEERFGREYDLDIFNIVAVSDFNMGAMENKGLNIFNDKYILADQETATDSDYAAIERVIAHEYFHNWTGDRITCRDWFQLCLKEGLTVYRDQEFSSDQRSRAVHRISDVRMLKAAQFPEDAGPLAHAVRPRQYSEINNFYTTTIYEKGAEIVRMVHTILGETLFRKGMDLYFERHDGQACTIEDFITCFSDVSLRDFTQFMLWYEQAGTPFVTVNTHFENDTLTLECTQSLAQTPGQKEKKPMAIPISFGLLGKDGKELEYRSDNQIQNNTIILSQEKQTFRFTHLKEKPVLSLLRNFSAPINIQSTLDEDALIFLAQFDKDLVNRWQSINTLLTRSLCDYSQRQDINSIQMPEKLVHLIQSLIVDDQLESDFIALCLQLPTEGEIARLLGFNIDPDRIYQVRQRFINSLAQQLKPHFISLYESLQDTNPFTPNAYQAGKRALKNVVLDYISIADNTPDYAFRQFRTADNMTDRMGAFTVLLHRFFNNEQSQKALHEFEERYHNDALVMDKWFSVQATIAGYKTLDHVRQLMKHRAFSLDNPNRIRALIGTFCGANPTGFNRIDGKGYDFLVEMILKIDPKNSQIASRLLTIARSWRQLEPTRREKFKQALEHIARQPQLSTDVKDIITRILA